MSEEVVVTAPEAPAEIIPAKSDDKLEIEKEEAEKKEADPEKTEAEASSEEKKEDKSAEDDDKKDEPAEEAAEAAAAAASGTDDDQKKRFKIKTPKVPGFLRSLSKEREKQKVRHNIIRLFVVLAAQWLLSEEEVDHY